MKLVYQTNSDGVYTGTTHAQESPLEPGVYLIPPGCVETPPPDAPDGHVAVWDDGWTVVSDYRGQTVYVNGAPVVIDTIGPLPAGATVNPPPPSADEIATRLAIAAQEALDKSDVTVARCYEYSVPVPEAWRTYRSDLRAIVKDKTSATALPARPPYPAGT